MKKTIKIMKIIILIAFVCTSIIGQSKSYLKIELDNSSHIIIFDGSLYMVNGKFEGEMDAGKHTISVLKHNHDITEGKVKTEIVYEGVLDLSDNMFYVYKLSNVYLSFVSVDTYTPILADISVSKESNAGSTSTTPVSTLPTGTPMEESNFESMLSKMNEKISDAQKRDFIKTTMKNNWFNCDQVLIILQNLGFENTKVELAKLIWSRTSDRENYFKIYDAFTFSSSEKAVQDYIDSQN